MRNYLNEVNAIKQLNLGDKAAFDWLFKLYAKKLYSYAYHLTYCKEDAEEIVQETFLKVWENKNKIRIDLSFNAYIITIAKNLIYNKAKKRLLERAFKEYYQYLNPYFDLVEIIETADHEEAKMSIINKLPEKRKEILLLRKNGYNNEEIATMLNISKSTVANQINKAIKDLQKLWDKSFLLLFF